MKIVLICNRHIIINQPYVGKRFLFEIQSVKALICIVIYAILQGVSIWMVLRNISKISKSRANMYSIFVKGRMK